MIHKLALLRPAPSAVCNLMAERNLDELYLEGRRTLKSLPMSHHTGQTLFVLFPHTMALTKYTTLPSNDHPMYSKVPVFRDRQCQGEGIRSRIIDMPEKNAKKPTFIAVWCGLQMI